MMREDLSQIYRINLFPSLKAMLLNSRITPSYMYRIFCCCCMSIILRWKNECEEKGKIYSNFFYFNIFFMRSSLLPVDGDRIKIFFSVSYCRLKKHTLVSSTSHPISFLLLILFSIFSHLTLSS